MPVLVELKRRLADALPQTLVRALDRFRGLTTATYDQDGLLTVHNCDFMSDPLFLRAYQAGKATGSWGNSEIHWRAYVACWAARNSLHREGHLVECGVNCGGLARTIVEYLDFGKVKKRFYLIDTYKGLDAKYASAAELRRFSNIYTDCYESVVATFQPFQNVVIVRGTVPEILPQIAVEKVSYLSIDMNCAAPERAALEFFWDRLTNGATVVLDDYGWRGLEAQKRSADEFAAARGVQVLALPTGQGLLFKP